MRITAIEKVVQNGFAAGEIKSRMVNEGPVALSDILGEIEARKAARTLNGRIDELDAELIVQRTAETWWTITRWSAKGSATGVSQEPGIVVVGEAQTRDEAIALVDKTLPDVVILDIRLRQDPGIEVAKRIRRDHPEIKIVILSAYDYDQYVRALARVGVDGYISKENSQEELVQAIREVMSGGVVLTPRVAGKVMRAIAEHPPSPSPSYVSQVDELTLREIEVIELMREGMRNVGSAEYLSISPRTVESHVARIMSKLGATSRTEAIKTATDMGFLT